jgi:hypothetical protein
MPLVRLTRQTSFGRRSYREWRMEHDVVVFLTVLFGRRLESVGPSVLPSKSMKSPVTAAMTLEVFRFGLVVDKQVLITLVSGFYKVQYCVMFENTLSYLGDSWAMRTWAGSDSCRLHLWRLHHPGASQE